MKKLLYITVILLNLKVQAQDTLVVLKTNIEFEINYDIITNGTKSYLIKDSLNVSHLFHFKNRKGACKYYSFYESGNLKCFGRFGNSKKFSKNNWYNIDSETGYTTEILVNISLDPKKKGIWRFYDSKGKLVRLEKFRKGKYIKSIAYSPLGEKITTRVVILPVDKK
jgi:antitoxin component YwqK of YwqJK toxin-antitoxin module